MLACCWMIVEFLNPDSAEKTAIDVDLRLNLPHVMTHDISCFYGNHRRN